MKLYTPKFSPLTVPDPERSCATVDICKVMVAVVAVLVMVMVVVVVMVAVLVVVVEEVLVV